MAELKTDFGGQTPSLPINDEVSVDDVDELIENANRLIESVYRDISTSGISTTQDLTNTSSVRMQSAPTQRQLEIQRILRFCETVDEEVHPTLRRRSGSSEAPCTRSPTRLQSVANVRIDMDSTFVQNGSVDNITAESTNAEPSVQLNTNSSSNVRATSNNAVNNRRNSTSNHSCRRYSAADASNRSVFNTAFVLNEDSGNRNVIAPNANIAAEELIDLSNVPSTISIASMQQRGNPAPLTIPEDDDVIVVSCECPDIIDLCDTPGRDVVIQRPVVATNTNTTTTSNRRLYRQNRTRLNSPPSSWQNYRSRSPFGTISEMTSSRSVQTSTTHIQQPQQQRQLFLAKSVSSSESAGVGAVTATASNNSLNSSGSSSDRSILTCPVCMESSVKRKPTSTKCGHVFCETCIQQALRVTHKCPMCNTKLSSRMLFRIYL